MHSALVLPTTDAVPGPALALHGRGPAAEVYDVAGSAGVRPVVVKVYPRAPDPLTEAAYQREQSALASLQTGSSILRPSAVTMYSDGRWGLIMDRCDRSLAELIATGPLPVQEILRYAEGIARVLADAHGAGLLHGGLTPSNVRFDGAGRLLLADFGLVLRRHFPRDLRVDAGYAAPERLRGEPLGPRSDLYGLGCLLYAGLTGESPFPPAPEEPLDDHVRRVLNASAPPIEPVDGPPELGALVARLLAKDPAQRPADAAELARLLAEWRRVRQPRGATGPAFDDFFDAVFDQAQTTTPVEPSPLPPRPLPPRPARSANRARYVPVALAVAGAAVAVVAAAFVPTALGPGASDRPTDVPSAPIAVPTLKNPPVPRPTPRATTVLEVVEFVDRRTTVRLSWRAVGTFDYAVVIAVQGREKPEVHFVQRRTTVDLPVEPNLAYCFQIQATDGHQLVETRPRPIRGATCRD